MNEAPWSRDIVGTYAWDAYLHQELYDMVKTNAKGPAAATETDAAWTAFTERMTASRDRVEQLLADAGVVWQGQAADSMKGGVSPLAAWADEAATAGQASQASVQQYVETFSRASNGMPEPVVVPSKETNGVPTNFTGLLAGQTDEDPIEQEAQTAKQKAVDQMTAYNFGGKDAAETVGKFSEPVSVNINTQQMSDPGGEAGGMIDSSDYADDASGGDKSDSGGPGASSPYPGTSGPPSGYQPPPGADSGTSSSQSTPPAVAPHLPTTQLPPGGQTAAPSHPFAPVSGVLGPVGGSPGSGSPGGGRGGGVGGGGRGAPGYGAPGTGERGPAAGPGRGGPMAGEPAAARGGTPAGGRPGQPGAGGAMGGAGAGRGGEEDKEHTAPQYLRDYHDEFWDNTPPVAPPVIGVDDD